MVILSFLNFCHSKIWLIGHFFVILNRVPVGTEQNTQKLGSKNDSLVTVFFEFNVNS